MSIESCGPGGRFAAGGCGTFEQVALSSGTGSELRATRSAYADQHKQPDQGITVASARFIFEDDRRISVRFADAQTIELVQAPPAAGSERMIHRDGSFGGMMAIMRVRLAFERLIDALRTELSDPSCPVRPEATTLAWEILAANKPRVAGTLEGWSVSGQVELTPDERHELECALRHASRDGGRGDCSDDSSAARD